MTFDNLKILEWLSLIYEDLDIDTVEHRFVELTDELFSFDRIALFFVKHRRAILQGKLSKGFNPGQIEQLEIPISEKFSLTRPLVSGLPVWNETDENDPFVTELDLTRYAVIPIINKKRISCWELTRCQEKSCPAYGNTWVRCWLVSDTKCSSGHKISRQGKQEKCEACPVYHQQNTNSVEGVLLVDNSLSQKAISNDAVMMLSIIGHTVGVAVNNSKRFEKTLRLAIKDDLTGLHNRRYFNDRLLDELERARRYPGEPLSLLMIDIDFFKKVNDNYGHQRGDAVLIWFADFLQKNLRKSDILARYGGEEFAIILLNTDIKKAYEVAEDLRRAVKRQSAKETGGIALTISVGAATVSETPPSFKALLAKVDKALYSAKAQSRDTTVTAQ